MTTIYLTDKDYEVLHSGNMDEITRHVNTLRAELFQGDTLQALLKYNLDIIEYEKKALADDDPNGKCAAHHRGAIEAHRRVVEFIYKRNPNVTTTHR